MSNYTPEEWAAKQREMRERYGPIGGRGLRPKPLPVPWGHMAEGTLDERIARDNERRRTDEANVARARSVIDGGMAKPPSDRTQPFGTRAGPMRSVLQDHLAKLERMPHGKQT